MKKLLIAILSVICLLCFAVGCLLEDDNSSTLPDSSIGGDVYIEVPEGETILPLPDSVTAPEKTNLPATDALSAPYIGAVGSTTDAYSVNEIKIGEKIVGAKISYPASVKTLGDYNFVWFDVYNYTPEYCNVRIDMQDISSAEKLAVAAMYTQAYDNNYPAMGIIVESLMDGTLSFVSDMSLIYIADGDYKTLENSLAQMTVCRLYVYIDSNPSQAPSDKIGSLTISGISFLKEGDPAITVDNSPQIGQITSDGYTLEQNIGDSVFKTVYKTNELGSNSKITVQINRFAGAYGRVKLQYAASGAKQLYVSNGDDIIGEYKLNNSGEITLDIRGYKALNQLCFAIDINQEETSEQRTFELTSIEFIYTPYVTDSWSATSKFWIENGKHALGGKVAASYDYNVGWDYLSAKVNYWSPEYKIMVAKIKAYGSETSGSPERFGLSVNSNNVILEVQYNSFSNLEYDESTQEYNLVVDLSSVKKLSALNFFFDSAFIEQFDGTRTIEFTSIEFYKSSDDVDSDKQPQIGEMSDPYNCNYTITDNNDGSYKVEWNSANKQEWGKTSMLVKWYDATYKYLKLTLKSQAEFKLGIYRSKLWNNSEDVLMEHTVISAGENTLYIQISETTPTLGEIGNSFEVRYFFDAGLTDTSGAVDVLAELVTEKPRNLFTIGALSDMNNEGYTITNADENSWKVVWTEQRISTWAKAKLPVTSFDTKYKYIRLSFTSQNASKVGLYVNDIAWKGHTALNVGTDEWIIEIPQGTSGDFDMIFYFDGGFVSSGDVTMGIEFLVEKPVVSITLGAITATAGHTVTAVENGYKVEWIANKEGAYVPMHVSNWSEKYAYFTFTVTNNGTSAAKIGLWWNGWSVSWMDHTEIAAGETKTFTVSALSVTANEFDLYFFTNGGLQTEGCLTITNMYFSETTQA